KSGRLAAEAVLQAMTTAFTPRPISSVAISVAKSLTISSGLEPYGTRAVSPRYRKHSSGSALIRALSTVNPPNPESKTAMGSCWCDCWLGPADAVWDTRRAYHRPQRPGDELADSRQVGRENLPRMRTNLAVSGCRLRLLTRWR